MNQVYQLDFIRRQSFYREEEEASVSSLLAEDSSKASPRGQVIKQFQSNIIKYDWSSYLKNQIKCSGCVSTLWQWWEKSVSESLIAISSKSLLIRFSIGGSFHGFFDNCPEYMFWCSSFFNYKVLPIRKLISIDICSTKKKEFFSVVSIVY